MWSTLPSLCAGVRSSPKPPALLTEFMLACFGAVAGAACELLRDFAMPAERCLKGRCLIYFPGVALGARSVSAQCALWFPLPWKSRRGNVHAVRGSSRLFGSEQRCCLRCSFATAENARAEV
ncbi:hypothetical protein TRVL_08812 [Trypanosoma vivax]|nr:hypothetical protein TRVL_08812 [Trypanosoma vivax]